MAKNSDDDVFTDWANFGVALLDRSFGTAIEEGYYAIGDTFTDDEVTKTTDQRLEEILARQQVPSGPVPDATTPPPQQGVPASGGNPDYLAGQPALYSGPAQPLDLLPEPAGPALPPVQPQPQLAGAGGSPWLGVPPSQPPVQQLGPAPRPPAQLPQTPALYPQPQPPAGMPAGYGYGNAGNQAAAMYQGAAYQGVQQARFAQGPRAEGEMANQRAIRFIEIVVAGPSYIVGILRTLGIYNEVVTLASEFAKFGVAGLDLNPISSFFLNKIIDYIVYRVSADPQAAPDAIKLLVDKGITSYAGTPESNNYNARRFQALAPSYIGLR